MEPTKSGLTRRSFLTGLAGTSALAAVTLAGCAPQAASSAKNETTEKANSSAGNTAQSWLGEAPAVDKVDETKETNLLIIGAGNGGMAAAAYAADLGLDFIVAEKSDSVGATRHWFAALDTPPFTSQGLSVDRPLLMGEIVRYSQGNCDQRLIKMWMDESADMFTFVDGIMTKSGAKVIADEYEMPGGMGGTPYYTPPFEHHYGDANGGRDIEERNKLFEKHMNEAGHQVSFQHDLLKLVREDNGRVTGAIFKTPNGTVQINAKSAVLLTTGGYPANPDMVTALSPVTALSVTALGYNQNNTGGGIKAAMWAGATKDLASATMIFDRGLVAPGTKAGYTDESVKSGSPMFPSNGQFNPGTQPFLKVNINGERFANESADYDYLPHAAAQQPNGVYCSIWDGNFGEDVQRFHTLGCSGMTRNMVQGSKKEDGTYDLDKFFAKELEAGTLQKANTLEELAEKLGLPKETFLATVKRYNELYANQLDDDFGKEAYRLSSLSTPPFFGATLGGTLLTTIDGIRINKDCQAIDTKGQPIEGLYAAGDCSGSVFSGCYPDQLHGFACGRTMTEAIHVVKQVASTK